MNSVKEAVMALVTELLTSKKFVVVFGTLAAALGAKYGLNVDQQTVEMVVGAVMAWVVGQGVADHGKSKAKIDQAALEAMTAKLKEAVLAHAGPGYEAVPKKGD